MVVSRDDHQLFITESSCIWRVSVVDQSYVKWLTSETTGHAFDKLSLTSRRLLVTSWPRHQYDVTDRQLLRVVDLSEHVKCVYHAVETTRGTFVVGHEGTLQDRRQRAVSELFSVCHRWLNKVIINYKFKIIFNQTIYTQWHSNTSLILLHAPSW